MDDLIEWLRAQLDEDERACREEVDAMELFRSQQDPTAVDAIWVPPLSLIGNPADPDRVLIEVEAKRRILDEFVPEVDSMDDQIDQAFAVGSRTYPPISDQLLQLLALPYATRDGYREEWRP